MRSVRCGILGEYTSRPSNNNSPWVSVSIDLARVLVFYSSSTRRNQIIEIGKPPNNYRPINAVQTTN